MDIKKLFKRKTKWDEVAVGHKVLVKDGKETLNGVLLAVCGGEDKGKLRVNIEGDEAQYREIEAKNVALVPETTFKAIKEGLGFDQALVAVKAGARIACVPGLTLEIFQGQLVEVMPNGNRRQCKGIALQFLTCENWQILEEVEA